ncbi:MAG: hypothetical protein QNJ42_01660 [Crocosphaera sp.]|nr:hypothetical protein [Crocosphaera sp.]
MDFIKNYQMPHLIMQIVTITSLIVNFATYKINRDYYFKESCLHPINQ